MNLARIGFTVFIFCSILQANETDVLSKIRQLTFEGLRAGEGYFSADGNSLVFQSERAEDNPFYQIYLLNLLDGNTKRISTGKGKTTCAWIHPSQKQVLFASTHLDPDALKKQKDELAFRASGKQRRYAWDYDPTYDLFSWNEADGSYHQLTSARGYDAEGSYSPDGNWIVFSSNRLAFSQDMTEKDRGRFKIDPAYMMDLFIMPADGGTPERLTTAKGYDGGPFFNADGSKICWRRFSPSGETAEIFVMDLKSREEQQITRLGAMSWAPFFHPSGHYLIFTTNLHGFGNFELYLADAAGQKKPVRITHTDGFDGLPAFSPDGKRLAWTSNRTSSGQSQLFMAQWDHAKALELLGFSGEGEKAAQPLSRGHREIHIADLKHHIKALTAPQMAGRLTGTEGEKLATAYAASIFEQLGLQPAGGNGTFFQEFPFVAGISPGKDNHLEFRGLTATFDQDWRPLAFSKVGSLAKAAIVFAGYGIKAPAQGNIPAYDAFGDADLRGKWVMVLRFLPQSLGKEQKQYLRRFAGTRHKAMMARELGAAGILFVTGPETEVKEELIPLAFDASLAGTSLPAVSVSRRFAGKVLAGTGKSLASLQLALDKGEKFEPVQCHGELSGAIDLVQETRKGRNVLARLPGEGKKPLPAVVIGAHIDHLGRGLGGGSLAKGEEKGGIHHGADDNASGVAAVLEIAQALADRNMHQGWRPTHDVLFAAWSGEELGLLGSSFFVSRLQSNPHQGIYPQIAAYLNMDMVGRLEKHLVLQGLGSSNGWSRQIERSNIALGLPILTQKDAYLPTDATSFYLAGVPVLSGFTGSHQQYHTPGDVVELINFQGLKEITQFFSAVAVSLANRTEPLDYQKMEPPKGGGSRTAMRVYLGTIPDYATGDALGLKLSGVAKSGPAEKAGLRSGDLVVELGGQKVENIYDYTYAIDALKVGEMAKVVVLREGKRLHFEITPTSRQ